MDKPDLIEVVSRYIELRKSGREYIGLALCHPDHHPSGRYNQEKQKWFCDPCGRGGDVIDFVMLAEGLTFPQALRALGIDTEGEHKPRPALTNSRKASAELAAAWVRDQREKLNSLIAESFAQRDLADEIDDSELAEIFDREIILLRAFYDALRHPRGVADLLAFRTPIEQITVEAEIIHTPPPQLFPPLTAEYLARLNENRLNFQGCFR
jgi:hypothetical protein